MLTQLNETDMLEINGGIATIVITGAMVIKGIGILATGVTVGTVIGKTIKGLIS